MKKSIDSLMLLLLLICSCSSGSSSESSETEEPDFVGTFATLQTNEAEDIAAKQAVVWGGG